MSLVEDSGGTGEQCEYQIDAEDPSTWPDWVENKPADDLPACQAKPIDGHDRCGLHLEPQERPAEFDAAAAVTEQLAKVGDTSVMTAGETGVGNLIGIKLETLELEELISELNQDRIKTIDLRYADVRGAVKADGLTISPELDLRGARISQFRAPGATFEAPVRLSNAEVGPLSETQQTSKETTSVLYLPRVTCAARLILESARIHGNVTLSESAELDQLLATEAVIDGVFSLDGSAIQTQIVLADLHCQQFSAINSELERVDCRRFTVDSRTQLQHTTLSGISDDNQIKFTGASFNGHLDLSQATFTDPVNFKNVTAQAAVMAENVDWTHSVDAADIAVHGPIDLSDSVISGEGTWTESLFAAEATFKGVVFADTADFGEARFEDTAVFDEATFIEPVDFESAVFAEDCSFRATAEAEETDEPAGATPATAAESTAQGVDAETDKDAEPEFASDGGTGTQSSRKGSVFQDDVRFDDANIEGRADFRLLEGTESDATESSSELILQETATVGGKFSAVEAQFQNAEFSGFSANGEITFNRADLSEATLREADLTRAKIEQARLSQGNLFGADLGGAYLHGTVFEGARIDNRTQFGDRVVYHQDADKAETKAIKLTLIEKAISLYSQLETLARDNGQSTIARELFVSRNDAQRQRILLSQTDRSYAIVGDVDGDSWLARVNDRVDYTFATAKREIMRYGESYKRVLGTAAAIIFVLGFVFPFTDLNHAVAGSISYQGSPLEIADALGYGLLYSLSSFTALGVAGFHPGPVAETLAVLEAGAGIIMFGLLLFVLQRRTIR